MSVGRFYTLKAMKFLTFIINMFLVIQLRNQRVAGAVFALELKRLKANIIAGKQLKQLKRMRLKTIPAGLCVGAICMALSAEAVTITGTGNAGQSASAVITQSGNVLTIDLSNTGAPASEAAGLLLGLYFDLPSGVTLTPINGVSLPHGFEPGYNTVVNNFGEGWAYGTGLNAFGHAAGIAGSGAANGMPPLGNFWSTGVSLDGGDYGIANGLASNVNPSVKNPTAHIDAVFQLTVGGTGSLNLTTFGNTMVFQWGTSLTEGAGGPGFPPQGGLPDGGTTVALLGLGLASLGAFARRFAA